MDVRWHDRSLPACQRPLLEEGQARNRRLVAEKGAINRRMDLQEEARLESELEEKQRFRKQLESLSSSSFQDRSSFPAAPNEGGKALLNARPILLRPNKHNPTLYILTGREREPTCILARSFGSKALDRHQATMALPASSSPRARMAALPIRTNAKSKRCSNRI